MPAPSLHTLPPELQALVVGLLLQKSDLRSVCLTNKSLCVAALPLLYEDVRIDLNTTCYPNLSSFFTTDNTGHKFVRGLDFIAADDTPSDTAGVLKTIKIAIQMLPKDVLHTFFMPECLAPDAELLLLLGNHQRKLVDLELGGPLNSTLTEVLSATCCSSSWLGSLKHITIPSNIGDINDLVGYNQVLQRATKLETLVIHVEKADDEHLNSTLYDTDHTTGTFTSTLFGHIAPFGSAPALVLADFRIRSFELASHSFTNFISFAQLTDLTIFWCDGSRHLLQDLSSIFEMQGSTLRKFVYAGHAAEEGALEPLIKGCPPLQNLQLESRAVEDRTAKFDHACLTKHLPKMTVNGLDFQTLTDSGAWNSSPTSCAVSKMLVNCLRLEELAISMPSIVLSPTLDPVYSHAILTLAKCPSLRILRIANWPAAPKGCLTLDHDGTADDKEMSDLRFARYSGMLDRLATDVLRIITVSRRNAKLGRLQALVLGHSGGAQCVTEEGHPLNVEADSICYVAGFQTDANGFSDVVAIRKTTEEFEGIGGWMDIVHEF
ncbi:hypothetical protein LTR85_003668 [Meristemomyces frigidus]|nr:hypothetical protein LTR85_003668 [Meristemomyces frigidus]